MILSMKLNIMILSIMTLSIKTLIRTTSIMTLSAMILSVPHSLMTLSEMIRSINTFGLRTLSITELSVIQLSKKGFNVTA
jgi:hypothetical protein